MDVTLREAVPWLRAFGGTTMVIKVGGELCRTAPQRSALATDLVALHQLGLRIVLVHGGGPQLDTAAEQAGLTHERVAGRRITSPELVSIAAQAWRGDLSAAWIGAFRQAGESAVGLSGLDGGLIRASRRPPALVTDDQGTRQHVDFGSVGDVCSVDPTALTALLDAGLIPVVNPLCMDDDGALLNINADTIAASLAVALGASKLILMTTAPGILSDPSDLGSVLHTTSLDHLATLDEQGSLKGGMRPKVAAIRLALNGGVDRAHVVDGRQPGSLLGELFTADGVGTLVMPRSPVA